MDEMGSYVPNTSRRVLGILVFFLGGEPLSRSCREFFFSKMFVVVVVVVVFRSCFFCFLFIGSFSIFRHRTLCPED